VKLRNEIQCIACKQVTRKEVGYVARAYSLEVCCRLCAIQEVTLCCCMHFYVKVAGYDYKL
jgi:hypothetical protein